MVYNKRKIMRKLKYLGPNILFLQINLIFITVIFLLSTAKAFATQNNNSETVIPIMDSVYSTDIIAIQNQLRDAFIASDYDLVWSLGKKNLDYRYMPADMIVLIARAADLVGETRHADSIIRTALTLHPHNLVLNDYRAILSARRGDCRLIKQHDMPKSQAIWIGRPYADFRIRCLGIVAPPQYDLFVSVERGVLPYQKNYTATNLQAESGSFLSDFCTVFETICPPSNIFPLPASAPHRNFIKTVFDIYQPLQQTYHYHLAFSGSWQHFQTANLNILADDIKAGFDYTRFITEKRHYKLFSSISSYNGKYGYPDFGLSRHQLTIGLRQINTPHPVTLKTGIVPDLWGWQADYTRSFHKDGVDRQTNFFLFQSWDKLFGEIYTDIGYQTVDYPAAYNSGDLKSNFWTIKFTRSISNAQNLITKFSFGFTYKKSHYSQTLIWRRLPDMIRQSQSWLSLYFKPLFNRIEPKLTIDILNRASPDPLHAFYQNKIIAGFKISL